MNYLFFLSTNISLSHLNIIFVIGLALFAGTAGGRLFKKLKIPQVVGYIAIGILIGQSGFNLINQDILHTLQPLTYFALGLIGFMIGGELKKNVLYKYGKQLINILLFEGISAFIFVTVFVGVIGWFLFKDWKISWVLGLLLGAIASATAPAATSAVLQEYKTRGPLTRTLLGIVALDDALALLLFALASSVAGAISKQAGRSILETIFIPLYEIFGSIGIGAVSGLILVKLLKIYSEESILLTFAIGIILLMSSLAFVIKVDMLLAAMSLGVVVTNAILKKGEDIFKLIRSFAPPIYVVFFVLVGANLNIGHMTSSIIILGLVYLLARSFGKSVGANLGARLSGASKSVRKYLPLCLLSQAGVAVGLSILASHYFPGQIGSAVIIIITATAFILEIVGPTMVKIAVTKAEEVGLNITEEDIIKNSKVKDLMDKNPPIIYDSMKLNDILKIFTEDDNLYYPVINKNNKLKGIITVEGIKQTLFETDVEGLILAYDFMEPVVAKISSDIEAREVMDIFARHDTEYVPVVGQNDILEGFIERKKVYKYISTKMIELQKQADSLE